MMSNVVTIGCFLLGIGFGLAGYAPDWLLHPSLPSLLLALLIFQVGIGLGAKDNLNEILRSLRVRMLLLPAFTIAGSLLFSAGAVLLLTGRSLAECLAVGSGFGYYSLSSVLIADLGPAAFGEGRAAELAAVALLANVIREVLTLFGLSLFARWCGQVAPISAAGINSMDVCLPGIVRYSGGGSSLVPLAVMHGIALEVSVPLLIGLFCRP